MTQKKILVVEDEAIIALNLQNMLGALGYEVPMLCYSGEDAIEMIAEINPDLVLMDIVLKGEMDGIQAAGHIQRQFDIPVVYLTVHAEEDTLQRAKITGPFGYVLKPVSERELYTNIEVALYKHKVEKALRQAYDELEIKVQERTKELVKANRELRAEIVERKRAEEERERLFEQVRAGREQLQTLSHRLVEVQETERRNIARELHDEIGQALTGLKLLLDSLLDQPETTTGHLQKAQTVVDELVNQVHDLSLDMRPSMLDDLGLLPTLMWHFQRFSDLTRVQVNFEHAGLDMRFPPAVETATYRIVQEALTNVARHAKVTEAAVRVWVDRELLHLQVEDQGIGFEYKVMVDSGSASGLLGMRERANLLGGQLEIAATPANGTTVTASLPITGRLERRGSER